MSRANIWKSCNRKNPELEKFLAGVDEKTITRDKIYTHKEFTNIIGVNTPNNILPLKIYPDPHSVILVKNKYLDGGFGIFNPNGYTISMNGNVILTFDFLIQAPPGNKETDINSYAEKIFENVSPMKHLNRGSDSLNPGYCGTFGIIFMVYFKNTHYVNNWNTKWIDFLNIVAKPFELKKTSDSLGLRLASDAQLIIKNNTNYYTMEMQILEKIQEYFTMVSIGFPNVNIKRKRMGFGSAKNKHLYNNRMYTINIGPRGGRYIIVGGNKKYIN